MPRPRRCSTASWRACRRPGCCCSSTTGPSTQHAWGSKTYYTQLRHRPAAAGERRGAARRPARATTRACSRSSTLLIERTEGNPFFLEESVRTLVETEVLAGERGAYRLATCRRSIAGPGDGPGDPGGAHRPAAARGQAAAADRRGHRQGRAVRAAAGHRRAARGGAARRPRPTCRPPSSSTRRALSRSRVHLQARADPRGHVRRACCRSVGASCTRGSSTRSRRSTAIASTEQIERLAHHALRGELREKAVHYLRQAGLKAAARSALQDARAWFEQALGVLEALPESQSTLEQAFEIRLELRPVLTPAR